MLHKAMNSLHDKIQSMGYGIAGVIKSRDLAVSRKA